MENTENTFTKQVGNTTFIVNVKQSEAAKKSLETMFRSLCMREVLGDFCNLDSNLEKLKNSS